MIEWSIFLFCLTLVISLAQAAYVASFARKLKSFDAKLDLSDDLPSAAVILCVRGIDPSLNDCLDAVVNLDYSDFELHIVIDHPDDPASKLVNDFANQQNGVHVHVLDHPKESCSLKCSSLTQVISRLDDAIEIVAMVDADSVPHRDWLNRIAAALSVANVGLVSGIRCYTPADHSLGSLIRYQWNSAATVQMYIYRIPWGGTLALKLSTIKELDLMNKWENAFCEDTMLTKIFDEHNLKTRILPSLVMPNSESCRPNDFLNWASRQLLTVRLYNSSWPFVVAHSATTTFVLFASIFTLAVAMAVSNAAATYWCIAALAVYFVANWLMLISNQSSIDHQLRATGQFKHWLDSAKQCKLFFTMPITQWFYFVATIKAAFGQEVSWRQIRYKIDGPMQIERQNHSVYTTNKSNSSGSESL